MACWRVCIILQQHTRLSWEFCISDQAKPATCYLLPSSLYRYSCDAIRSVVPFWATTHIHIYVPKYTYFNLKTFRKTSDTVWMRCAPSRHILWKQRFAHIDIARFYSQSYGRDLTRQRQVKYQKACAPKCVVMQLFTNRRKTQNQTKRAHEDAKYINKQQQRFYHLL